MTFKIGDYVVLNRNPSSMNAKEGSTAYVTGVNGDMIDVEWEVVICDEDLHQNDGEYPVSYFDFDEKDDYLIANISRAAEALRNRGYTVNVSYTAPAVGGSPVNIGDNVFVADTLPGVVIAIDNFLVLVEYDDDGERIWVNESLITTTS